MTTQPKQANNKIFKFKNYLLARMHCKRQDYMMLKDTTCKTKRYYIKKLILPLQMSPCGIMDLSLTSYKFSPLHRQSIIHYPPFLGPLPLVDTTCRPLPLVNYYDIAFGPTN